MQQRIRHADLQVQPALPPRRLSLHFVGLRERRQQRRSLGDLRHFLRWREAFEREGEHGLRFHRSVGRLAELGERERRAQFEAARRLLLRDGDGGLEGVFGGRGVGGLAFEQNFAARPMQLCFECAIARAVGRRQRFVEDGDGAAGVARAGLGLGQPDLQ